MVIANFLQLLEGSPETSIVVNKPKDSLVVVGSLAYDVSYSTKELTIIEAESQSGRIFTFYLTFISLFEELDKDKTVCGKVNSCAEVVDVRLRAKPYVNE